MKVNWRLAVFSTVLAFAGYQTASAQQTAYQISDSSVNYTSTAYLGEAGCAADPTCAADCTSCDAGCATGCSSCGFGCSREPWKLFDVSHGCNSIEVGGWLNGGITLAGRNVNSNAPIAFNNPVDEFLLNQAWFYISKEADTGGCGWDFGYRIDYVYGADGPDTQAFGDGGWDFGMNYNANYGSAFPQFYGEVAYNNLKVKAGHFFTLIGYEVVPATGNFFYSHAYTMNYGEPFTHTGFVGEYSVNDNVTAYAGYTFGWDSGFSNYFDAHTFLGGLSVDVTDNVSLAYMTTFGNFGDGVGHLVAQPNANFGNIYMHSIVATVGLTDNLEYVFQSDYGTNTGAGATGDEWYGANSYLFYTLNDCWKLGARYEIFRDEAGTNNPNGGVAGAGNGGRVGNGAETYQAGTLGVNWLPHSNVTIRPELRWDWVNKNSQAFSGNNSLFTFGVDAIFTF